MSSDLIARLREAEALLRQGEHLDARRVLSAVRRDAQKLGRDRDALQTHVSRYQEMLSRTLEVTAAKGLAPVAERVLDGLSTVVGAERGFLGLLGVKEGWRILAARNLGHTDVPDPDGQVSTGIIGEMLGTRAPVVVHDASEEFGRRASVNRLDLRSVVCLPLEAGGSAGRLVYLESRSSSGVFDEAAVAAATAWLPFLGRCLRDAAGEGAPAEVFSEVVTRSGAMAAVLAELARVAAFDVSVLLTGETGTGKSLIAQQLHRASPRADGPFTHVNCGAIPEALIESELFGHRKGSFTGASADRTGLLAASTGGTVFLDELDSMPPSCQVKLLVALQERRVTPIGARESVPVDVRIISAMGADPFDAIDAGRLREDLYYRLAVFVGELPPLRSRTEDVPLLASHFLEGTRERYHLPPLRLSEGALDTLLAHDWPGNVRELANVLDRAALLASGGTIDQVVIHRRRSRSASQPGKDPVDAARLVAGLEDAARRLLVAMERHPELRSWDTADAFKAAVLLAAVRERGGKEEGFRFLGLDSLVDNRNHHRALRREAARLDALCEALGEELSEDLRRLR